MKKIFMSIIAVAALTMAMSSCSKDESTKPGDIPFTFENPEVLDQVKTYFVGFDQFWTAGDQISIVDGSRYNKALYTATVNPDGSAHFTFERQIKGNTIDLTGNIEGVYPASIASAYGYVSLPARQYSEAGEVNDFPLYANGPLETFTWKNLCGWASFKLTGNATIDSISITTDQYLNGTFSVNIANDVTPLTYKGITGHGTKTNTVRYATPIQLTSEMQRLNIYLPAGTYNTFTITFYSNGNKFVKRNAGPTTISRSYASALTLTLNSTDFVPATKGALNAIYNVGTGNVMFSQGILEYITSGREYWRLADNQWGFRGNPGTSSQKDRDQFVWGANGYTIDGRTAAGNGISVYKTAYFTGTILDGVNEWGNNPIANAVAGWRTLTKAEMTYLLNNYRNYKVTLSFVGKSGLLIIPDTYNGIDITNGASLSKSDWNELEAAGCVFFENASYWLNTATTDNASALVIGTTAAINDATAKSTRASVRLVKDVE